LVSKVIVKPISGDLKSVIKECFNIFGGVDSICKGKIFIKFNGTAPIPEIITCPNVIISTVEVISEYIAPKNIYVMENSTVGFCTRFCFEIEDLGKNVEQMGANVLYLDEEEAVEVEFNATALDKPIPIPKILYEHLVRKKGENTYINIPKLKSHIQCGITACIKNQHGLLYDNEKVYHHHLINEKLIEIMRLFKPDFNIIDATSVINYGPTLIDKKFNIPMGLLLAGKDPVAVDTIAGKLIGIEDAKYIQMAAKEGFGTNNFEEIDVIPSKNIISQYAIKLDHDVDKIPIPHHESERFFRGTEMACKTGCLGFDSLRTRSDLPIRPYAFVYGKGHDIKELDNHSGPFIVNGPCAVAELKPYFDERKKKDKVRVFYVDEHLDISSVYKYYLKAMKLTIEDLAYDIPISTERLLELMQQSFQHGGKFLSLM
jgi:uncharacterized protein (DUF362 family)